MVFARNYYNRIKSFYLQHERPILLLSFFTGFLWDNLTLRRIDLLYENIVFALNLFYVFFTITLINAYSEGRLRGKFFDRVVVFLPILMQFAFGNIFSGFIVFYSRAGSFFSSWPFLFMLGFFFVGNEFFKKRYKHLIFQLSVFFTVLFTYAVFIVPILTKKMGPEVFLLSGALSLVFFGLLLFLYYLIMPVKLKANLKRLILIVGFIYAGFQVLYFTNVIPPIPLSVKQSGIYHSIEKVSQGQYLYEVSLEPEQNPLLFFKDQSSVFHWARQTPVFFYSAVFSPTNLNTKILHRWSYYDQAKNKWVETDTIPLPQIVGGRAGGYRGYSYKTNVFPGKWRVEVITERGQVISRRVFTIVQADAPSELETALR